ncbi:MAG: hypothetical protein M3552_07205 [Planctomycetota bacterium]|nr:hypothetical protein [Planctomycetaceae bacterium]MDQ3330424.1 hypothetical protein [Planctomycetota bacterium]
MQARTRGRVVAVMPPMTHAVLMTCVRLSLIVAAIGVIAVALFQLPETATTHGELVIGAVLATAVGLQMLVAAFFFPMSRAAR